MRIAEACAGKEIGAALLLLHTCTLARGLCFHSSPIKPVELKLRRLHGPYRFLLEEKKEETKQQWMRISVRAA